jgi:hypothetical protein
LRYWGRYPFFNWYFIYPRIKYLCNRLLVKNSWRYWGRLEFNLQVQHIPNLAKVLSGDGGVVTASCLYFLVTASIRTVGEGCAVSPFGEFLGLVK